ncbi:4191_t:CDS:2 [Scutellospora calospora]|uniref:4191_t:CDS:1 n=1 Tax=Scutellospora calospora TaxID=85575 RepID=A0ACA9JU47_9GLOM|nr:4191_t:CDS:2 [Scutellospora calospora]
MKKSLLMIIIIFSLFLYVSSIKPNSKSNCQCYDYPNPLNRNNKVLVPCPISKQKKISTSNLADLAVQGSKKNMFDVTFKCGVSDSVLCGASPARTIPLQDDDGLVRQYPQALVKQFQFQSHPEYGPYDILAMFNSAGTNFWFDGDGKIKPDQQDFLYVVLHEIIHGLGFTSNWQDYINENNPTALTPDISFIPEGDSKLKFNGFTESAFDKYIINLSTGHRTSEITNQLNEFAGGVGTEFSSEAQFKSKFKASPQYSISRNMMKTMITPYSLGFLPHDSNSSTQAVVLETSLCPYEQGSSVSHVDLNTYNATSDFLMKYLADRGATMSALTELRGCANIIGPKLILILETLGYV